MDAVCEPVCLSVLKSELKHGEPPASRRSSVINPSSCECLSMQCLPRVYTQDYVCFRPVRLGSNEEWTTRALSPGLASFTWRWRWSSVRVGPSAPSTTSLVLFAAGFLQRVRSTLRERAWIGIAQTSTPHLFARLRALTALNIFVIGLSY